VSPFLFLCSSHDLCLFVQISKRNSVDIRALLIQQSSQMQYVRFNESRGFKYACGGHLYSQYTVRDKQPVEREIARQHCRERGTVHQTCKLYSCHLCCQFSLLRKINYLHIHNLVITYRIVQMRFQYHRAPSHQLGVWRVKFPSGFARAEPRPLEGYCYVIALRVIMSGITLSPHPHLTERSHFSSDLR